MLGSFSPSSGTFLREEVLALGCFLKVESGEEVLCFLLGDSGGVERGEDEEGLTGFLAKIFSKFATGPELKSAASSSSLPLMIGKRAFLGPEINLLT